MTLEARRDQLVEELDTLMSIVVSPDFFSQRDAAGNAPEGSLLAELELQMKEKTRELEAINACMNRSSYRFWAVSHGLLFLLWLCAGGMILFTFTMAPALGPGYLLLFGVLAALSAAWAIWASVTPSV